MATHPIVHVEIPAKSQEASAKFYASLFGWSTEAYPEMNYTMFRAEGGPGGGFPTAGEGGHKINSVLVHVGTDDVDASLKQVESLGGATVLPKTEIPGIGWFAIFSDPAGNNLALYQDANQG